MSNDTPTPDAPAWASAPAQSGYWTQAPPAPAAPPLVEPLPREPAARVLLAALLAGLAAQLLFAFERFGLNVALWSAIVLAGAWLLRRPDARLDPADRWLPPAAIAFAAFLALRDDAALHLFNLPATAGLTLAAVAALGGNPVSRRAWSGVAGLGFATGALFVAGATRLLAGIEPLRGSISRGSALVPMLRGMLISLPLALVFLVLFSAADAVFAAYLANTLGLELDVHQLLVRAVVAGLAAWLFAGTMVAAWLRRPLPFDGAAPAEKAGQGWRLGTVEALTVLIALDAVFASFVLLQAAYLFGGLDTLAASGMTYSEYARRGFFELILVCLLAGSIVLALDRFLARRTWAYRTAAIALLALNGMVLLSAVVRLGLYQQAYGWTELRFYALLAIGWLALGLVAILVALLVDRLELVPRVLIGAVFVLALGANAIGPQSFVTGQNLERAMNPALVPADGESGLDIDYLGALGDDALPAMVAALPHLPDAERRAADRLLERRAARIAEQAVELGWPSWNLARQHAIDALVRGGYLVLNDR